MLQSWTLDWADLLSRILKSIIRIRISDYFDKPRTDLFYNCTSVFLVCIRHCLGPHIGFKLYRLVDISRYVFVMIVIGSLGFERGIGLILPVEAVTSTPQLINMVADFGDDRRYRIA